MMNNLEERVDKMIENWDKLKKTNCRDLSNLILEYCDRVETICCQCRGSVQRSIDILRKKRNENRGK